MALSLDSMRQWQTTCLLLAVSAPIIGTPVLGNQMYAVYDLLEKNPGYDFVMYPQVYNKTTGVPGIFTKTDIKVSARLGKLKN